MYDIYRFNEPNNYNLINVPNNILFKFYQDKDSITDFDQFEKFIKHSVSQFRKSDEYKAYKSILMNNGLNKCQIYGNIDNEMASIEMHHNILTIYDDAMIIALHVINTYGMINSFMLIQLLIQAHYDNIIPVTMLSETAHQYYHSYNGYLPPNMIHGNWWEFLSNYRYGITLPIAKKIINYLNNTEMKMEHNINILLRNEVLPLHVLNNYYIGGIYDNY